MLGQDMQLGSLLLTLAAAEATVRRPQSIAYGESSTGKNGGTPVQTKVAQRKKLSLEDRQRIHDTWLSHSNVTVDRRNGRDQVTIDQSQYITMYGDLDDPSVTFSRNNRNMDVAKATRHIATQTVREIQMLLEQAWSQACSWDSI